MCPSVCEMEEFNERLRQAVSKFPNELSDDSVTGTLIEARKFYEYKDDEIQHGLFFVQEEDLFGLLSRLDPTGRCGRARPRLASEVNSRCGRACCVIL